MSREDNGFNNGSDVPAVLYVDDEPYSVKYFMRFFQQDFPILTAADAAEATALLENHGDSVGVLITDHRMPKETGVELLGRVKQQYPDIVRLLTTAYADLDGAVSAVNSGEIYRYILKPWDIEELRGELRQAMAAHLQKRRERELLDARRRTMMSLASHIAHELRTPLVTIRALAAGLEDCWPDLIGAYRRDAGRAGRLPSILPTHLESLEQAPTEIQSVVDRANMLINMLLMNAREEGGADSLSERFSVAEAIDDALSRYPFDDVQRDRVRREGGDFDAFGSEILFGYLLFNLIRNSLHALGPDCRGEIVIRVEPGEPDNRIVFRDTGSGIPRHLLPRVFDEFFTGKRAGAGTGMGLPFCRRVMQGFGGQIDCVSKEGEFTEIELCFPPPVEEHCRIQNEARK